MLTSWANTAIFSNELLVPVVIVGGVGVGLAITENYLVRHGQTVIADTIKTVTSIAIPVITAFGAVYFLSKSIPLFL